MDWKIFATTFITIFLAELGDKTQFAAMAAATQSKSTISVLLGVVLALVCAGAIGVILGKVLGNFLGPQLMKWISGFLFIVIGLWTLIGR